MTEGQTVAAILNHRQPVDDQTVAHAAEEIGAEQLTQWADAILAATFGLRTMEDKVPWLSSAASRRYLAGRRGTANPDGDRRLSDLSSFPNLHFKPRTPTGAEMALGRAAVEKLTEAEMRAIAAWARSPAFWPGLVAWQAAHGLPKAEKTGRYIGGSASSRNADGSLRPRAENHDQ